jgi:hypothetical protein
MDDDDLFDEFDALDVLDDRLLLTAALAAGALDGDDERACECWCGCERVHLETEDRCESCRVGEHA